MIDLALYRARIGLYSGSKQSKSKYKNRNIILLELLKEGVLHFTREGVKVNTGNVFCNIVCVLFLIIYMYVLCLLMAIETSCNSYIHSFTTSGIISTVNFSHCKDPLNNYFLILIMQVVKKWIQFNIRYNKTFKDQFMHFIRKVINIYQNLPLSYWTALLNFIFIIICNPGIVNPGPLHGNPRLSVFYQNIRGFISPDQLGDPNPMLNMNKLSEFQSYIYDKKPDVIILNETWLSKNINDSEIFPCSTYKIFRIDRTQKTHPLDPDNPNKFKRNGGGVLIAVKAVLDCESILIKDKCKAEIISVELRLRSGKSICLSTFYRVGTLGAENHREVDKYLRGLAKRKKFSKIILIGDLNLDKII